jgi:hypothetical protein
LTFSSSVERVPELRSLRNTYKKVVGAFGEDSSLIFSFPACLGYSNFGPQIFGRKKREKNRFFENRFAKPVSLKKPV